MHTLFVNLNYEFESGEYDTSIGQETVEKDKKSLEINFHRWLMNPFPFQILKMRTFIFPVGTIIVLSTLISSGLCLIKIAAPPNDYCLRSNYIIFNLSNLTIALTNEDE